MPEPRLNAIRPAAQAPAAASTPASAPRPAAKGGAFGEALAKAQQAQGVRFSSHAQKRLDKREIQLGDDGLARLNDAVDRAAQRGGRESLVLMDDLAFIVNVKERLVVTAMSGESRKAGVFTQIDSVVLADSASQAAAGSSAQAAGETEEKK
jgi:flagellar operon protein